MIPSLQVELQAGSPEPGEFHATTAGACWTKSAGLDGERDPRDEAGLVAAEVRAAFRTLR
jgi:hypothetical protein